MKRRNGFTLIEILVVITIILILIGLVLAGMKHATTNSKENLTIIQVENLHSMLAEMDANGGLSAIDTPGFLANPGDVKEETYASTTPTTPLTSPAVGRWKSAGVVASQRAVGHLRRISANRQNMQNMTNIVQQQTTGAPYASKPTAPATPINVQSVMAPGYGVPDPPIPADAWGNPIVFAPSQGMNVTGTFDGSAVQYSKGVVMFDGSKYYRALKGGATEAGKADKAAWEELPGYAPIMASPGHKPFFASAGPDGDFRSPDDNIYSFTR